MTRIAERMRQVVTRALRDRKGAISMITAISMTSVLGFVGLGTEAGYWYVTKRNMQGVADAAAFTGAAALLKSDSPTNAAATVAAQAGFVQGTNNVSVTVNNGPQSGNYIGNKWAVEVVISQPQPRLLSTLFMSSDPVISARAVALVEANCVSQKTCGCVLALDQSSYIDIKDSGNVTLNMQNCSMYVNSDNRTSALWLNGNVTVNAYSTFVDGGINGISHLNDSNGTYDNTGTVSPDPYRTVNYDPYSQTVCDNTTGLPPAGSTTYTPGVYCAGMTMNTSQSYTMAPGTYYLKGGNFTVNGSASVTGTGVTVVLTGNSTTGYGNVKINGAGNVSLTAPTSGDLQGIVFYQDRAAPYSTLPQINQINGGSNINITGAIYFPNQLVDYSGGTTQGSAQCTQLVAYAINFSGNAALNYSGCDSAGVGKIGVTWAMLVE